MFNQGIWRVQEMLRENNSEEAVFDVSKLTVFEMIFYQLLMMSLKLIHKLKILIYG